MKKDKKEKSEWMEFPNQHEKTWRKKKDYKYLDILEMDTAK